MKNGIRSLAVGMTIISILASTFSGGSVRAKETDKTTKDETKDSVSTDIRPQDDYFGYINAEVLKNADISKALQELDIIERELKSFSPDKVVWDIEDLSQEPPWGDDISPDITDLSNYFVTSDGENLITIMRHAFEKGVEMAEDVCVTAI